MRRVVEVASLVLLAGFGALLGCALLEVGVRVAHLVPDRFWEPDPELA